MGKHFKFQIGLVLIAVMAFSLCQLWNIEGIFAEEAKGPNVVVSVTGEDKKGGPLFASTGNMGQGLWYPGKEAKGVLRIHNNYSQKVRVESLGIIMELKDKDNKNVEDKELYELFAKTMRLTTEKGNFMRFIEHPVYENSFYEMLYQAGSSVYRGYPLSESSKFEIDTGKDMDLRYTVKMEDTGLPQNNLQGLTAAVTFLINVQDKPSPGGDDGGPDYEKEDPLEEEPIEIIPDIAGHWAHDCIKTLLKHGIIRGYPDGTIRPNQSITRAESAVLIGKALKLEEEHKLFSGYIDWIPGWAKGYIIATSEKEIFKGYPLRRFKANKNISRQEMVTVLIRGFEKKLEEDEDLSFTDQDEIGDWALEYVKAGVHHEILMGYPDGTFKPKQDITRAEAFVIICKLMGLHEDHVEED